MQRIPRSSSARVLAAIAAWIGLSAAVHLGAREVRPLDSEWRFFKGDSPGANLSVYDDSKWRIVTLPHDWAIEGPFEESQPSGRGGGYAPSGISWYRKTFSLPDSAREKLVLVEFDGVMGNSEAWINGEPLGKRPYGYVSHRYDLTPHLKFGAGAVNVLTVRTNTTQQPASHWYTGQGIYRHVRLVLCDRVHLAHDGVFVTTPSVTSESAAVSIQVKVASAETSERAVTVAVSLRALGADAGGVPAPASQAISLPANTTKDCTFALTVPRPRLWDVDSPNLYEARIELRAGDHVLDAQTVNFGVRSFEFKADTGFWLNGRNLKIYGVCVHEDGGAFGTAVPMRLWERRLQALKSLGVNAVRTAHNPPAPAFLDLCDRLGVMVLLELFDTWRARVGGAEFGYQHHFDLWWQTDTRDMVLRDRNHPSVIMYSVGNEIRDNLAAEAGRQTFVGLRDLIRQHDPTRPVTFAIFRPNDPTQQVYQNGFAELMDVIGQDYRETELLDAWKEKPARKVIGTANSHARSTWLALRDNQFMAGQFIWSGLDYLGEADWPFVFSSTGLLDHTGAPKPIALERASWWAKRPVVHMVRNEEDGGLGPLVADWSPQDPEVYREARISVFSNCEEVELFLNDRSLDSKRRNAADAPRVWRTPFEPGVLKAVGSNGGVVVAEEIMRTAGPPARIVLAASRPELSPAWDDVVIVTATLADAQGNPCPHGSASVTFAVTGPGVIPVTANADNASHEPFQSLVRQTFQGRCVAYVKALPGAGPIVVTASAPDLSPATVTLAVGAPK